MQTNSDPAKWMVVALFACLHLAIWGWRRAKSPFRFKNLMTGILTVLLSGCCLLWPIVALSEGNWLPIAPMICGLVLCSRQENTNYRVGIAFLGMLAALGFSLAKSQLIHLPQYMDSQVSWEEGNYEVTSNGLPSLDWQDGKTVYPAGYVDRNMFGDQNASSPGPFHLRLPEPLWHTPITGIYSRSKKAYRLWIPGGTAEYCLSKALAVPVGTPPGQEQNQGLPLQAYEDYNEDF